MVGNIDSTKFETGYKNIVLKFITSVIETKKTDKRVITIFVFESIVFTRFFSDSYSLRQISKKISPDLYLVSSICFLVISTELSIVNLRITKKDTFVVTL